MHGLWGPAMGSPDALKALQEARKQAQARAKEEAAKAADMPDVDYDEAECLVQLIIASYSIGLRFTFGVLTDGMAVYCRLNIPANAADARAGMVAFVASSDTLAVLRKAVLALQAGPKSNFWKQDQWASRQASQ